MNVESFTKIAKQVDCILDFVIIGLFSYETLSFSSKVGKF